MVDMILSPNKPLYWKEFEIELFLHLTVYKQKTVLMLNEVFEIEFFGHLTLCEQMTDV